MTDLISERDGHVLRLTINREDKRNALSADVMRGILDGVAARQRDKSLRLSAGSSRLFPQGPNLLG